MRQIVVVNRHDPKFKRKLNELMQQVFGFTFDKWDAFNLWDDRYQAYSVEDEGRLVANVSVAEMELLQNGQRQQAIQIGGVATLPEFRGQGLSRALMEHVLQRHPGKPAFLFAHDAVLDFYPRFGFQRLSEIQPTIQLPKPLQGGNGTLLAPDNPVILRRLKSRQQFSAMVDVVDATWINLFHVLMEFGHATYYLQEQDAVVVAKREEDTVVIYDILCDPETPPASLIAGLPFPGARRLEFAFTPDWLGLAYQELPFTRGPSLGFLFGRGMDFGAHCKFPYMCVT